jgi:UDP-N-acetylmuramyl pentapeptide synthase
MGSFCLDDLRTITGGRLVFGPMPPREGECMPLGRIAIDSRLVRRGDVFWQLPGAGNPTPCDAQHALLRGAAGVVVEQQPSSPWPGAFCLVVEDSVAQLARLLDVLDRQAALAEQQAASDDFHVAREFLAKSPELKLLQLCGSQGPDITRPRCSQSAAFPTNERCHGRAA